MNHYAPIKPDQLQVMQGLTSRPFGMAEAFSAIVNADRKTKAATPVLQKAEQLNDGDYARFDEAPYVVARQSGNIVQLIHFSVDAKGGIHYKRYQADAQDFNAYFKSFDEVTGATSSRTGVYILSRVYADAHMVDDFIETMVAMKTSDNQDALEISRNVPPLLKEELRRRIETGAMETFLQDDKLATTHKLAISPLSKKYPLPKEDMPKWQPDTGSMVVLNADPYNRNGKASILQIKGF